jgi:FdhD protein
VAGQKEIDVVRVRDGEWTALSDRAAVEEPLEVRLHGKPFAVIMRTPGADRDLAAGFLLAERVLTSADDLGTIEYCRMPAGAGAAGLAAAENVINVTLSGRAHDDLERVLAERRQIVTSASCGLCGRLTIESLRAEVAPLPSTDGVRLPHRIVARLPHQLRAAQAVFEETGGLHAAGLFSQDATLVAFAEDVGRHNAVDKVIGRILVRDALPLSNFVLFVSGRTSFEIVQKALLAGVPIVASVSAPSSLAIELARETGIALIGFVRGDSFNIYSHPERVDRMPSRDAADHGFSEGRPI